MSDDDPEPSAESRSPPPASSSSSGRRWLRWLRWPRRIALGLLVMVLSLALVAVAALYTELGTRGLLRLGVWGYSSWIAGTIRFETTEGSLASGVTLEGIEAQDARGRTLVRAQALRLSLDPAAALAGHLVLDDWRLADARILLPSDEGLADLAPPPSDEPEPEPPPTDRLGPDLPVRITATVHLAGVELLTGPSLEQAGRVVRVDELRLWADAMGTIADARLDVGATVGTDELADTRVSLAIAWADPLVSVSRLSASAEPGWVRLVGARLDLRTLAAELPGLWGQVDSGWWHRRTGLAAADAPSLRLEGAGDPESLHAELHADAGPLGSIEMWARGAVEPRLRLSSRLRVHARPDRASPRMPTGAVDLELALAAQGDPSERVSAQMLLRCLGCGPDDRGLRLGVRAQGDPAVQRGEATARLRYATSQLRAQAQLQDALAAELELVAVDLAEIAAVAERFGVSLPVRGRLGGSLQCRGSRALAPLQCSTALALDSGDPVQRARIRAVARSTRLEQWLLGVPELDVRASPLTVALKGPGMRAQLGPQRVLVTGLDLAVGTPTGRGRVVVDGRLERRDDSGELTLGIHDLDLRALDALLPSLRARGRLQATAAVTGSLRDPQADLALRSTGTAVAGVRLGRVGLKARLREQRVSSTLDVAGSGLGRWTLRSTIPVQLDSQRQALLVDQRMSADLRVQQLELAALRPLLPPPLMLAGTIDLDVGLRGTLRAPTLRARLDGRDVQLDGRPLGTLGVEAGHRRGLATVTATLEHPEVTGLQVEAEVPIDVDLEAGAVRWRPDRPHSAHVHVDDVDLRLAQTWAELPLSGHVGLDARLSDTMRAPTLGLTASFDDVGYRDRTIASGGMELRYEQQQASIRAEASGPAFEGLGLVATVPVDIDAARGRASWRSSRPHSLDLSVAGLQLRRAASLLDPAPDVEGRVSAYVTVRGDADRPGVQATVDGDRLAYGGRTVGQLDVEAEYRDRRVDTQLQWQQDARRTVELTASVPLNVDARAGLVAWRPNAAHRVTLAVPRLDPTMLAPFVELPEDLDFAVALHGIGEGTPEAFELSASARGYGGLATLPRQPVDLHVSADPNHQQLSLRIGPEGPGASLDARAQAPVARLVSGAAVLDEVRIDGQLSAPTLPLRILEALLPEDLYDVRGTASIEASVGGTVAQPSLAGQVEVLDAAAVVVPLRQRIEGLRLEASLEDLRVVLRELSLRSGRGSVQARGQAQLEPNRSVQASVTVTADRLPVRRPGLPFLEISTEISTTARIDPSHTEVSVKLRDSKVDVISTNVAEAKPIPESSTVRYVADLDAQTPAWSGRARSDPSGPPSTSAFDLELVDPLRIRGPAVDMSWTGNLHADGRGDRLSARGSLEARDGFFELIDNRFVIERGKVTIPASSQLRLFADIIAVAQVDEVEVTATIRGGLPQPELTLRSTPSLTDSQIFALLLTGNANFDAADPDQVEAQAAALLTAFTSPALQRQLNDRLRVDRIGLGVGESTNQPILSVGKNLTHSIYAETQYHHNAPAQENRAELRVRYRFAPRWSLETFVGDAAVAGLDVFWGKTFDGPPRNERTAPAEP